MLAPPYVPNDSPSICMRDGVRRTDGRFCPDATRGPASPLRNAGHNIKRLSRGTSKSYRIVVRMFSDASLEAVMNSIKNGLGMRKTENRGG